MNNDLTAFFSLHDNEGKYISACDNVTDLIGWSVDELIGKSAYEFFHQTDLYRITKSHVGTKMKTQYVLYRIKTKNDNYKWFYTISYQENNLIYCCNIHIKLNLIFKILMILKRTIEYNVFNKKIN